MFYFYLPEIIAVAFSQKLYLMQMYRKALTCVMLPLTQYSSLPFDLKKFAKFRIYTNDLSRKNYAKLRVSLA